MKRILALILCSMLFPASAMAVQNFQTIYLVSSVRVGSASLGRGIYEVLWNTTTESRARLTIRAEDRKTLTVFAQVVPGKQDRTGVVTSVVDGITYLQELRTSNAKFILLNSKGKAR